jgi:hypothetical protein
MSQTIEQALSKASFYSDNETYTLVHLPPSAVIAAAGVIAEINEPFCALVVDKDEVSLLIPTEALDDFGQRLPGHVTSTQAYRLITIDVALEPTLIGFMAHVTTALAQVGIPIFPYAAYSRDHIVVPAQHFDLAIATLERLKTQAKG